jgi:hypothetical protein
MPGTPILLRNIPNSVSAFFMISHRVWGAESLDSRYINLPLKNLLTLGGRKLEGSNITRLINTEPYVGKLLWLTLTTGNFINSTDAVRGRQRPRWDWNEVIQTRRAMSQGEATARNVILSLCSLRPNVQLIKKPKSHHSQNKAYFFKNFVFWDMTSCSPWKVSRRFGGIFRPSSSGSKNKSSKKVACYLLHIGFLLGLFFYPEDGSDMFFRNISWISTDYTALHPKR